MVNIASKERDLSTNLNDQNKMIIDAHGAKEHEVNKLVLALA